MENQEGLPASCECPECDKHEGPNPLVMKLRIIGFLAEFIVAVYAVARKKSKVIAAVWLAAIIAFATILRYFICARCEGYGKKCYSMYIGKYTSFLFPEQKGKEVPLWAFIGEAAAINLMVSTPILAMTGKANRKLRGVYSAIVFYNLMMQYLHACRHCALYAEEDWRRMCPSNKSIRFLFRK